jgi:hypothetical protein
MHKPNPPPLSYAQSRALYESAQARGDAKAATLAAADMQRAAQSIVGRTP